MSEARTDSVQLPSGSAGIKAYQKERFKMMREAAGRGEPYGICGADEAEEIFTAFGMPCVVNVWWSAIIAAKRMSAYYGDLLNKKGYQTTNYYRSLGLASTMDHNPETAPWGGLPKPAVIVGSNKASELWAREFGCPFFPVEVDKGRIPVNLPPRWWERIEDHWDEMVEPHLLNYKVEELKALISLLELTTGRVLSVARLNEVMELVNEQEHYWRMARDLIAETVPCPVSLSDQLSRYSAQWFRGTPEGRDLIKGFYEEVKEKVRKGEAACPNEKIRLMWVGAGLWFNTAFFSYFEKEYGATFVATRYTNIAADGYARTILNNDPLTTLAARYVLFPVKDNEFNVKIAKQHKCDAVITLSKRKGNPQFFQAFERAGIPVLDIPGDVVDARQWDDAKVRSIVSNFIETRLLS